MRVKHLSNDNQMFNNVGLSVFLSIYGPITYVAHCLTGSGTAPNVSVLYRKIWSAKLTITPGVVAKALA